VTSYCTVGGCSVDEVSWYGVYYNIIAGSDFQITPVGYVDVVHIETIE